MLPNLEAGQANLVEGISAPQANEEDTEEALDGNVP